MKERHKIVPAVYLILEKDDQILLMRRSNTGYEDGNHGLPSGHVEPNEGPKKAIIRESEEELGIKVDPADLMYVHTMYRTKRAGSGEERVDFFFRADRWAREPENKEPNKCDDLRWFPRNNLPDNLIPYIQEALDHYKREIGFSEYIEI